MSTTKTTKVISIYAKVKLDGIQAEAEVNVQAD
jgi:hypothetical protein